MLFLQMRMEVNVNLSESLGTFFPFYIYPVSKTYIYTKKQTNEKTTANVHVVLCL